LVHNLFIKPGFGHKSRALVIDGHAISRSILVAQLRTLGVDQVLQCGGPQTARQHMEARGFDVVLCEHKLEDGSRGSDMIDDLRRLQLLSLSTVVVMLSSVSSRDVVSQVAESALDGFLIKPYSARALEERLMRAFRRKDSLKQILEAVDQSRYDDGLALCETRFVARGPYWTNAARIGAELALRLDRLPLASTMYDAVWADKAVPWAKLGLARSLEASGQWGGAVSTIQNLLAAEPTYADAYDVMGKIYAEQGEFDKAVNAYRQAAEITPTSVVRLQKYGVLAYYAGDQAAALKALEQAAVFGAGSPKFDHQSLVLLALTKHRQGGEEGLRSCRTMLTTLVDLAADNERKASFPDAVPAVRQLRMQRLAGTARAFLAMIDNDLESARASLDSLAAELKQPEFDVEAATNLLSLLAVMARAGLTVAASPAWVRDAGLRFCTSKQATEMLVKACDDAPEYEALVRKAAADLSEVTRDALGHSVAGQHRRAVEQLLAWAERTRNAKLLRDARATLMRYLDRIDRTEPLLAQCEALHVLLRIQAPLPPITVA
jgi:DNA-binding response OmpR family regulator